MAKWWIEKLDPSRHKDHMRSSCMAGGAFVPDSLPAIARQPVYFVRVCGFTFEFHRLDDLRECLEHFSKKVHPRSRLPASPIERYWQPWHQRLPLRLFEGSRRERVTHALQHALEEFERS